MLEAARTTRSSDVADQLATCVMLPESAGGSVVAYRGYELRGFCPDTNLDNIMSLLLPCAIALQEAKLSLGLPTA